MKKNRFLPELIITLLTFLFCIYGVGPAEHIGVNEGTGYDGNYYVQYARELPRLLEKKEINKYYLSRFFPSVAVRGMMEVCAFIKGVEVSSLSKATVINLFSIWSAFCLLGSVIVLLNVFKDYTAQVKWGLWILLIGNFFILKMTFFYPTLTDITAFFLASIILWAYKKNYYTILLIACVLGYFTHPLLFYTGMLIWFFREPNKNNPLVISEKWNWLIIILVLSGFLIKLFLAIRNPPEHLRAFTPLLLPLSIGLVLLYLGYLLYALNPLRKIQELVNGLKGKRILIAALVWGMLNLVTYLYSNGKPGMGFREFLYLITYDSITDPLIFFVAHVVYFGPAVLLIIFFFPAVKNKLEQESVGLQFAFWAGLLLFMNSESRQMIIFWPLIIYMLSEVVKEKVVTKKYLLVSIGIVAFVWSKAWLTLQPFAYRINEADDFPEQLYFMNQGPWMVHSMYLLQLILILLMSVLLYAALKFLPSNTDQRTPDSAY